MNKTKLYGILAVCAVALVLLCSAMEGYFNDDKSGIITRDNVRATWTSPGEFLLRDFAIESVQVDDMDKFVFFGSFENTSEKSINFMANAVALYDVDGNKYSISTKGASVMAQQGKNGFSQNEVAEKSQLTTYMVFDAPADVQADRIEICYDWMNKGFLIIKLDKK